MGGPSVFNTIFKEYIDVYGVDEATLDLLELKKRFTHELQAVYVDKQRARTPIMNILGKQIKEAEEERTQNQEGVDDAGNYGDQIAAVEHYSKIEINRNQTTVRQFFDRKNLMIKQLAAQPEAHANV